jgi:hypothetical protein
VARRSRGRVTLCAVCTMHELMRSASFLVEPQNQGQRFVSGLASKPLDWFVSDLASKPLRRFVSGSALQPLGRFLSVGFKTDGDGFSQIGLKTGRYGLMIWVSISPRWFLRLGLKTKRAFIYRLRHKTDRRMKTTQACFAWK